jgi:ribosome modulation factor
LIKPGAQKPEDLMAKKLNSETAAGIGHNQLTNDEVNAVLAAACVDLKALDDERSAFNARQRESRNKIKNGKIKGLLGMKVGDFNALVYRPFSLRQDEDNKEDFNLYLDTQRKAFSFLQLGEQADFLSVLDDLADQGRRDDIGQGNRAKGKGSKTGSKKGKAADQGRRDDNFEDDSLDTTDLALSKGLDAGREGKDFDSNPYPAGTKQHQYWSKGWRGGQKELADGIKKGGGSSGDRPALQ